MSRLIGSGTLAGMQRVLALMTLTIGLAACGPLSLYYKPGVSVARLQSDQTDCEVRALRDAPVATQIRQRPPIYVPGNRYCNPDGSCYSTPGYWVGGGFYTVDSNENLRGRATDQCMARRGYRPVDIPPCPVGLPVPAAATSTLPALTDRSCAIRNQDGTFQIVNRP